MTAQFPDGIRYEGNSYSLLANPLESLFGTERPRPPFVARSTANWRGYLASWVVEGDQLFLQNLEGQICVRQPDGLSRPTSWCPVGHGGECVVRQVDQTLIFPNEGELVPATWFGGRLTMPTGEMTQYVHAGYASQYEGYILLELEQGRVVSAETLNGQEYQDRINRERPARPQQEAAPRQRAKWWRFWRR